MAESASDAGTPATPTLDPAALAAQALTIAEDVQAVASSPGIHLIGRHAGIGSLGLAVELLARAVLSLADVAGVDATP